MTNPLKWIVIMMVKVFESLIIWVGSELEEDRKNPKQ